MGLGNSERFTGTIETLVEFEHELDPPDRYMWKNQKEFQYLLNSIKDRIAQVAGWIVQKMDTNTAFWLLGKSGDSFKSCKLFYFSPCTHSIFDLLYEEGVDQFTYSTQSFAETLGFEHNVQNLGRWWDLWQYIGALLYRVNRYKDDLFSDEFHQRLNQLIFTMLKLRRHFDVDQNDEDVLLFKFFVYENERGREDLTTQLAEMTQEELCEKVEEIYRKKDEKRSQGHESEVDPVVGGEKTAAEMVSEVSRTVCGKCGRYPPRRQVTLALLRTNEDMEAATDIVVNLVKKMKQQQKKFIVARLCQRCELAVLNPRNKSGFCRTCYVKEQKSASLQ